MSGSLKWQSNSFKNKIMKSGAHRKIKHLLFKNEECSLLIVHRSVGFPTNQKSFLCVFYTRIHANSGTSCGGERVRSITWEYGSLWFFWNKQFQTNNLCRQCDSKRIRIQHFFSDLLTAYKALQIFHPGLLRRPTGLCTGTNAFVFSPIIID